MIEASSEVQNSAYRPTLFFITFASTNNHSKMNALKSFLTAVFSLLVISPILSAQDVRYTPEDEKIFSEVISFATPMKELPTPDLVIEIALHLLGTPYVAGTLEEDPEMLTINLRQTDCILFVEMCTALALTAKSDAPSFSTYCDQVRSLRYRGSVVDGYSSRIHYTSEWILQGEEREIMKEISQELGRPLRQTFSYMTSHPQSYRQLKDSPDMLRLIGKAEQKLNQSDPYFYLSQKDIIKNSDKIHNGDIIGFVSTVEGLDISHVALAYWTPEKELHFIHASYKEKKVVIEKKKLADYAGNGLRLVRLK